MGLAVKIIYNLVHMDVHRSLVKVKAIRFINYICAIFCMHPYISGVIFCEKHLLTQFGLTAFHSLLKPLSCKVCALVQCTLVAGK